MDDFSGKFCKNGSFPVIRALKQCFDTPPPTTTTTTTTTTPTKPKPQQSTSVNLYRGMANCAKNIIFKKIFFFYLFFIKSFF
jgi:hypothetical protein